MKYFLDFDRTLFDTEALYDYAAASGTVPEPHATTLKTAFAGKADYSSDGWKAFNDALLRGEFRYVPRDTSRFLYPDVRDFLARHGPDSIIVTVGLPAIQRAKLEGTGIMPLIGGVVFAELEEKGMVLAEKFPEPIPGAIFVDDSLKQLASVRARCSWISVFEMRRDGAPGEGSYPVIRSLSELP